jgi:hypothetical protein
MNPAPGSGKPWNPANRLLVIPGPAQLNTGLLRGKDGVHRIVAVIYHPMGELTVGLDWDDAERWIADLTTQHARQSRFTTAPAPAAELPGQLGLPGIGGNGGRGGR